MWDEDEEEDLDQPWQLGPLPQIGDLVIIRVSPECPEHNSMTRLGGSEFYTKINGSEGYVVAPTLVQIATTIYKSGHTLAVRLLHRVAVLHEGTIREFSAGLFLLRELEITRAKTSNRSEDTCLPMWEQPSNSSGSMVPDTERASDPEKVSKRRLWPTVGDDGNLVIPPPE